MAKSPDDNSIMRSILGDFEIRANYKEQEINLSDVWRAGSQLRLREGNSAGDLGQWLAGDSRKRMAQRMCEKLDLAYVWRKTGRGRSVQYWANLHFAIYAAEYLSEEFHFMVIDGFITNKLMLIRESGCEDYKLLNICLDTLYNGKANVPAHVRIQVANEIRKKCGLPSKKDLEGRNPWNTVLATSDKLQLRDKLETFIIRSIKAGFIKEYDQIIEVIKSYDEY